MKLRRALSVSILMLPLVITGACGGGARSSEGAEGWQSRGPITLATGKDQTGVYPDIVAEWNRLHPQEPVRMIELPADVDAQRQQMIQNAQMKSDTFTVLDMDAVWTAEFAANRWVTELPEEHFDLASYLQPALKTAKYRDRLFAVPTTSDGAMLYYRTDLLDRVGATPPKTWTELESVCERVLALPEAAEMSCYAGQFEKYEGLVANFAEVVHSAGGEVVDEDGKPHVNTPEAERGLNFLVEGLRSGRIPREAIAFKEPESRRAFQEGSLVFSRWWPGQWSQLSARDGSSEVAGKFDVAPLPGADGPGVSTLGGHNLAISTYGKNKATALDFIKFRSDEQRQRMMLDEGSLAPTLASLYDDPAMREKYPYLPVLKKSIEGAEPRPKVVKYGEVTQAIQDEVYGALSGDKTSRRALADLQARLEGLIEP